MPLRLRVTLSDSGALEYLDCFASNPITSFVINDELQILKFSMYRKVVLKCLCSLQDFGDGEVGVLANKQGFKDCEQFVKLETWLANKVHEYCDDKDNIEVVSGIPPPKKNAID